MFLIVRLFRGDLGEEMYFILFGSLAMSNVSGQTTMVMQREAIAFVVVMKHEL